jgi:hypothetical protein
MSRSCSPLGTGLVVALKVPKKAAQGHHAVCCLLIVTNSSAISPRSQVILSAVAERVIVVMLHCPNASLNATMGANRSKVFLPFKLLTSLDVPGTNQKVKIACWTEMTRRYTMRIVLIIFLDVI